MDQKRYLGRGLSILFLLGWGCMVGPKYSAPEMAMPEGYEEERASEESQGDLARWWTQFNDPVLDQLIAEALKANYDLRLALERIEQTRAQYRIERSHLWPEIDLNVMATRTQISQNTFPTPSTPSGSAAPSFLPGFLNIFQVGFDAIWELDFFGKYRHGKNAAHALWEASQDDAESVLISLVSEVAVNYVTLRALQQKIALALAKVEADEQELAIVQDLFEIGIDNAIDQNTWISTLETDRAAIPVLETAFKQTVYALAFLLGQAPEGLMARFEEVGKVPSSRQKIPVGLPSELLRRRPDIRSAERQLAAATEQIGAAIADYFPHIALTGISFGAGNKLGSSIGLESNQLSSLLSSASKMFSVGVGINWNVLDFGRVRGQVDVQKSLERQALLTYEQTVIGSLKDVEGALTAYFEEEKRYASLEEKVAAERRNLEITENLFAIGLANEREVLTRRKSWIDATTAFVESQQAVAGDLIGVYKALGGNWLLPESAEEPAGSEEGSHSDEGHLPSVVQNDLGRECLQK